MMLIAVMLSAQVQAPDVQQPIAAIEWVDSYSDCLQVNFGQLTSAHRKIGPQEAARRALVRCRPVRVSAKSVIFDELSRVKPQRDSGAVVRMANRILNLAEEAFVARVGVLRKDAKQICDRLDPDACDGLR